MPVEVYHSGDDNRPTAPFLLLPLKSQPPAHPGGQKASWWYWKQVPLNTIAVNVPEAERSLEEVGYYIQ